MRVKEHPQFHSLERAMKAASRHLLKWEGTVYRSAPPKWSASRDMLTGMGSFRAGGRFNAAFSFLMVYTSTTPELAMSESLAFQRRAGLPIEQALPLVFKAIGVKVERLLDLTDPAVLIAIGVTSKQLLTDEWWLARLRGEESISQAVGRAAHANHLQALRVASSHSAEQGQNILLLPDRISPPSELKVLRRRRAADL